MIHAIECAQLNFDDTTFLMSSPLEAPKVIASVGTIGVLHPILVNGCACEGPYQIIAGFRRAYACREMGFETVQAQMYPIDPADLLPAFTLALYENLAHRTFNVVEKSLILTKLLNQFHCPREDVIQNYLPLLDLSPAENVLNMYIRLGQLEENIKRYIVRHDLPMTVIDLLADLTPEDRGVVFQLIADLKIGVNKLKEMLTFLEEIALRDQRAIHQILHDQAVQNILNQEQASAPQKTEALRHWIRQQRYPQFSSLEREYQERLGQLQLPRGVRLRADTYFERDDLAANFRFRSAEELRGYAEDLLTLSGAPELHALLDCIRG